MGKKSKKTRWRALTLNGHQSDSEESTAPSSLLHQNHTNYQNRYYSSKFTYSSQSTPTRKYQNESSKTTRSNSTTSEHKTTFNEDEYTRITTPRQDVLFKKGYLNKPKNYQTQTSTGTSSTANSTSTCTPDHQSADGTEGTDLEYESQFVFPNGFVDQNGIYYINSYEPFPFVVYNAPICYPDYPMERTKRYSTDSATESVSPHNEEAVQNGVSQPGEHYYNNTTASDNSNEESLRPKKKRRRKISRTKGDGTSCDTDSSDIVSEEIEFPTSVNIQQDSEHHNGDEGSKPTDDPQNALLQSITKSDDSNKCPLKPDAEEFIPRTFHVPPEVPFETNIQFVNFAPNFIPVPYMNHNPTFLPPGIPINYVPVPEPKFVNVIVPSAAEIKVTDSSTQAEISPEPIPCKKTIDIAKIVLKLEEAVEEQKQQQKLPGNQKRFQYQKNYHRKPMEKPKMQRPQTAQNNVRLGSNTPSRPNNYSDLKKVDIVSKPCMRYNKTLEPAMKPAKVANQWISVSSRKKKKKAIEQDDFEAIDREDQSDDLFESFDVNLLEDVVPPSKCVENDSEPQRILKLILEDGVRVSDADARQYSDDQNVNKRVQNEIITENELIAEDQIITENEAAEGTVWTDQTNTDIHDSANDETNQKTDTEKVEPLKSKEPKKKVKRAVQKPPLKRIMIKDVLQTTFTDIKSEIEETRTTPEAPPIDQNDTLEKKKKKKKKVKLQSVSSSSTTLNTLDDSYDFLLEGSLLEDSDQKTNVEMSQAFDLMIQKGMYNSLEEKIKALKIGASDDGFFKTINFGTLKTPQTPSKQIFAPPQFDKLFQEPAHMQTSTSTSKTIFLENPTVNEIKNVDVHIEPLAEPDSDTLYPITQAVKNWLTKTRENTPDVELLKSPFTIYKELGPVETPEEVTVWSISPETSQSDLLERWEAEIPKTQVEINGYLNDSVEEGEDAVEIYESKYGQNEDYLKLKAEVEEQQKRNFPRHGNLPYRAICCNIM